MYIEMQYLLLFTINNIETEMEEDAGDEEFIKAVGESFIDIFPNSINFKDSGLVVHCETMISKGSPTRLQYLLLFTINNIETMISKDSPTRLQYLLLFTINNIETIISKGSPTRLEKSRESCNALENIVY